MRARGKLALDGASDGLIVLGKLDGGVEALSARGSMRVTIELVGKSDPK
jgi:hypothetical protein